MAAETLERFMACVWPCPMSGCWIWVGRLDDGYPSFRIGGEYYRGHRLSYNQFADELTADKHVHHECELTCCVNHRHLAAVTMGEHATITHSGLPFGHRNSTGDIRFGGTASSLVAEGLLEPRPNRIPKGLLPTASWQAA